MSTTTKIDTGLEKLREALATGDTIAISHAMPWGMQTYQMAQAALEGYRSRDVKFAALEVIAMQQSQQIAALQAEKAELVEALKRIVCEVEAWCQDVEKDSNWDGWDEHYKCFHYRGGLDMYRAILTKHRKEA